MHFMEAEKTQDLLSAGWRPRKPSGVIQSEPKGLRTREGESRERNAVPIKEGQQMRV